MDSVHCAINNYTTLFSYVYLLCLFKENLEKEKENEKKGEKPRKDGREGGKETDKERRSSSLQCEKLINMFSQFYILVASIGSF